MKGTCCLIIKLNEKLSTFRIFILLVASSKRKAIKQANISHLIILSFPLPRPKMRVSFGIKNILARGLYVLLVLVQNSYKHTSLHMGNTVGTMILNIIAESVEGFLKWSQPSVYIRGWNPVKEDSTSFHEVCLVFGRMVPPWCVIMKNCSSE